ncbi:unnamed protein product [Trifolium pratense]|uniref:Uncharacterized protein n=1 Tax=Trifolium pratense TaxID=57577 RepID=A0ACB0K9Q7_TRIPR|nr:unnamed protein product [Trifolium pratense]
MRLKKSSAAEFEAEIAVLKGTNHKNLVTHFSYWLKENKKLIVYEDLKPSNIVFGNDMTVKVADFGQARLAPNEKASMEAKLGETFGYVAS